MLKNRGCVIEKLSSKRLIWVCMVVEVTREAQGVHSLLKCVETRA